VNIHGPHSYWKHGALAKRKACMGWSWAAASGVQGWGHIVAVARLQLVLYGLPPGRGVVVLQNAAGCLSGSSLVHDGSS